MTYATKGKEALALRKRAGAYIRDLRQARQLTQAQLAQRLGSIYFTMVSQVENGASRVPPESYAAWAKELEVPLDEFAKKLLSYYEPHIYAAIFQPPVKHRKSKVASEISGERDRPLTGPDGDENAGGTERRTRLVSG